MFHYILRTNVDMQVREMLKFIIITLSALAVVECKNQTHRRKFDAFMKQLDEEFPGYKGRPMPPELQEMIQIHKTGNDEVEECMNEFSECLAVHRSYTLCGMSKIIDAKTNVTSNVIRWFKNMCEFSYRLCRDGENSWVSLANSACSHLVEEEDDPSASDLADANHELGLFDSTPIKVPKLEEESPTINENKAPEIPGEKQPESQPETQHETQHEAQTEAKHETPQETQNEAQNEAKRETQPETQPETQHETQPETQPDTQHETQPETQPQTQQEKPSEVRSVRIDRLTKFFTSKHARPVLTGYRNNIKLRADELRDEIVKIANITETKEVNITELLNFTDAASVQLDTNKTFELNNLLEKIQKLLV